MQKAQSAIKSAINKNGFSLVEVMLTGAIFVLLVTALVGAWLYGEESEMLSGNRARAILIAEEGLEALRNIRDAGFSNLSDGTHGLTTTGNQWNLSGSSDTTDIFTRQIIISSVDTDIKSVTANVTWQQNPSRTGTVSLVTYITKWTAAKGEGVPPANCGEYCQTLPPGYTSGTCRQNSEQCTKNAETYEPGGDVICTTTFPGNPNYDTCCCLP
jgi:Tfp pilus assembly protein PilV